MREEEKAIDGFEALEASLKAAGDIEKKRETNNGVTDERFSNKVSPRDIQLPSYSNSYYRVAQAFPSLKIYSRSGEFELTPTSEVTSP